VAASGHGIEQDERLSPQNSADEYLLMGLRLAEGIDVKRLKAIDGRKLDDARLQQLEAHGLVKRTQDRLQATDTGRLVLDRLIVELAA
jgi:coproporphyrinogen III oxidase-like Fe-S oxidoreductase